MQGNLFVQNQLKTKYAERFNTAYNQLNPKQKEAVDTIEGPVLVNAGPGTGKTQILATRIGKILKEQEIAPHNILCLTFTDAATISMRNRLVEIIGPTAHQVHIFTFHGFCNQVIQENLDYFGGYRQLEPISDLESVDIYRQLIDNLSDESSLKRFKYDKYYEAKRLKNLFNLMKKENYTAEEFHKKVDQFLKEEKESDNYIYKRKTTRNEITYQKGDFNEKKYEEFAKKFELLKEGIDEFENYNKLMDEAERYDFNDMIRWVNDAFNSNENLLADYQERYQYFLVDEYQDTNGTQNAILDHLVGFWENPNVFAVGDDDQAIYKFQGANVGNIITYKNKYNPKIIILEENYRSNQYILDVSKNLIGLNAERIVNEDKSLTKNLIASGKNKEKGIIPEILAFDKQSDEYAYLASNLEQLFLNDPEVFNNSAVLYRNHKQVESLVDVLEKRNVPYNIKRRLNILEIPIIKNLINILSYLSDEFDRFGYGQHRIFELLHYNYFKINSVDIGKVSLYCKTPQENDKRPGWRSTIGDIDVLNKLDLKNANAIHSTSNLLDKWIGLIPEVTLQTLFENIINQGGILNYIMSQDNKAWLLQVLSTFFDFIKNETARNPEISLKEFLSLFDKMEENKIALSINKVIKSENGVNFITAHSAKGLEFEKVFMIGCTKNVWDKSYGSMNNYKYPDSVNADSKNNTEDERRLFFVGMTRAKTHLYITYARSTEEGKELGASQFLDEILATTDLKIKETVVDENTLAEFYYNLFLTVNKKIPLIEKNLIDEILNGYRLSVTHLNKYLRCPLTFYFESILRVPTARNASTGFGTAMHDALHYFILNLVQKKEKALSHLIYHFEKSMLKHKSHFTDGQFESYMTHGKNCLEALHLYKIDEWLRLDKVAVEENVSHAEYKGIPLKGVLDKVEIHKDHVNVVDYKTGKYKRDKLKPPDTKSPNGGDYWRQLVFYKMLLNSDKKHNWYMTSGEIDFIEPDKKTGSFVNHKYVVSEDDVAIVGEQIVDTFEKIKTYQFDTTCDEETCAWCNFVKDNYELNPALLNDDQ